MCGPRPAASARKIHYDAGQSPRCGDKEMVAKNEPSAELEDLRRRCTAKREALFNAANRKNRIARILHICGGIIALLSGLATATLSSPYVKFLSAFLAFASAAISLFASTYARNKDEQAMRKGAALFLSIRQKITTDLLKFRGNQRQLILTYETLDKRYRRISKKYDTYLSRLPGADPQQDTASCPPERLDGTL